MTVIGTSTEPANALFLKEAQLGAAALGIKLQYVDVRGTKDLEDGFLEATKGRADAVLVLAASILIFSANKDRRPRRKEPAPGDVHLKRICGDGGLFPYGTSVPDLFRRALFTWTRY